MKLFTVGPTEMYDEIKFVGGKQVPYFRTKEFSDVMLSIDCFLKKYLHTSRESKIIYLTASGTGAMEATVMNCLSNKDKILIINGGTFGERFKKICDLYSLNSTEIKLGTNEALTETHLARYDNCGFSVLLVNLHETSTGQLYDIKMISKFCKKNNMYLIVDAISTFLCDEYHMDENDIDVTIISSQKGLCVAPGMSMVAINSRILKERVMNNNVKSVYFDFNNYISNIERGQTPFTPAVGICMQIYQALKMIDKLGLEIYLERIEKKAIDFRARIGKLPLTIPKYPLSNAITPIIFKKPIAIDIFKSLKNEYDMIVNPTGGVNEDYILRIAHIGNNDFEDQKKLVECICKILVRYE